MLGWVRVHTVVMVFVLGSAVVIAAAPQEADQREIAALSAFEERIGEYAAIHQRLEAQLPPLTPSTDPRSFILNGVYLSAAIKTARPHAREGDIFTPVVAELFRAIIDEALQDDDVEAMLGDLYDDDPGVKAFHPHVYDAFPDWATHAMPMVLLQWLPPTPEDIEYRLIDHDLVLWDIHADLIVDVLRDVIPRPRPEFLIAYALFDPIPE